jgi:hypothetical protein
VVGLGPLSPVTHEGETRCVLLSHSRLDRPVAFPGIRGQGKAVGSETPPTALLFWCGFCLKSQMTARRFPPPWSAVLDGPIIIGRKGPAPTFLVLLDTHPSSRR